MRVLHPGNPGLLGYPGMERHVLRPHPRPAMPAKGRPLEPAQWRLLDHTHGELRALGAEKHAGEETPMPVRH